MIPRAGVARGLLFGLVVLAAPREALATTVINGGAVAGPVTWHAALGPYVVLGDYTVTGSGGFTVDAGTQIQFPGGDSQSGGVDPNRVEINAQVVAFNGTSAQPIVFSAQSGAMAGTWYGLDVAGTASYVVVRDGVIGIRDTNNQALSLAGLQVLNNMGEGLYVPGVALTFAGTTVAANNGSNGLELMAGTSIQDVIAHDNTLAGILVDAGSGTTTISNGLLYRNGTGVHALNAAAVVENVTMDGDGDGVVAEGTAPLTVIDSILSNSKQDGILIVGTPSSVKIDSDDVWNSGTANYSGTGAAPGLGCLSLDPKYNNPAADDYHLKTGSPCIDTAFVADGVTTDLDGTMRPLDGDGAWGADPDMGCYEAPAIASNPNPCVAGGTIVPGGTLTLGPSTVLQWSAACSPYYVIGTLKYVSEFGVLNLGPGTEVIFPGGDVRNPGSAPTLNTPNLQIGGSPGTGIVRLHAQNSPAPGTWGLVITGATGVGPSTVSYADIEDATTGLLNASNAMQASFVNVDHSTFLNDGTAIAGADNIAETVIGFCSTGVAPSGMFTSFAIDRTLVHDSVVGVDVGYQYGTTPSFTNSVFYSNTTAIKVETGSAPGPVPTPITVSQTTIANNGTGITLPSAGVLGGPVWQLGLVDSIVAFNQDGVVATALGGTGPTASITYSDVYGNTSVNLDPMFSPGIGTGSADPMFVSVATHDYHLQSGSFCIDDGAPALNYDYDGTVRPQGLGYDMGAFEYVPNDAGVVDAGTDAVGPSDSGADSLPQDSGPDSVGLEDASDSPNTPDSGSMDSSSSLDGGRPPSDAGDGSVGPPLDASGQPDTGSSSGGLDAAGGGTPEGGFPGEGDAATGAEPSGATPGGSSGCQCNAASTEGHDYGQLLASACALLLLRLRRRRETAGGH